MTKQERLAKDLGGNVDASIKPREVVTPPPVAAAPSGVTRDRESITVALDQVIADPDQPRKVFDEESLARLADSLRERGLLQQIGVRYRADLGKHMIVYGERRFRAARLAGLKTIRARLIEGELTADEILEEQLVENIHRTDLNPIEEARGFAVYSSRKGWSGKELAERMHLSASRVSRALALLELPAEVQEMVARGELGTRAAADVSRLDSAAEQIDLARRVVAEGMTKDETAAEVRGRKKLSGTISGGGSDPDTLPLPRPPATTHTLTLSRGVKVSIALPWQPVSGPELLDALREAVRMVETQQGDRAAA